ncbi:hypothetical protein B1806_11265 [Metallibacterium scheffleri]|uniref:Uncharacterized protein n=2 Tax=Metallibacterium scheffleri TaxID=993689 RepID=A0A4S3KKF6_9GAMM|nr:hypothetical protein B1806_11265 [Metallibacterium scheffleri]
MQNIIIADDVQQHHQQIISSDAAAARVVSELRDYAARHAAAVSPERADAGDDGEVGAAVRRVAALGAEITTGVGKTRALAELGAQAEALDIDLLILTRTLELRDDIDAAIRDAGGEAARYIARQSADAVQEAPELSPWLCHRAGEVERAGERNHRPAVSVCRECPHGRIVDYAAGGARAERAAAWFKAKDLLIQQFVASPCHFLYQGLPAVKSARVVVAQQGAMSDSLAMRVLPDGSKRQRLVVVDEAVPLGKLVSARVGDIDQWLANIAALRSRGAEYVRRWADVPSRADECAAWAGIIDLCGIADGVFRCAIAAIAQRQLPAAGTLVALLARAKLADQVAAGVARWERIALDASGDALSWSMPLRALVALAASLRDGVARVSAAGITFYEPAVVLEWARKRGSTIYLDATLPATLRAIIERQGGNVVRVVAHQRVQVSRIVGPSYARGLAGREGFPAYARACWRDYCAAAAQSSGGAWAHLVHLAHVVHAGADAMGIDVAAARAAGQTNSEIAAQCAAQFATQTGAAIGWWGRHERGHNDWCGRSVRIFGLPLLGLVADEASSDGAEGSMVAEWALARAAAITAGCDAAEWPEAVGEFDAVKGRPPLPVDARVRAWLIDRYAGDLIQAIGRARAARTAHTVRIELWGGIDDPAIDQALMRHGLEVESRWPNEVHNTARGRPALGGAEAIAVAIAAVQVDGGRVSVRGVLAALHEAGHGARREAVVTAVRAANSGGP